MASEYRCDNCRFCVKVGETWVPYSSIDVKFTDDWICTKGYDPTRCDCPPRTPEPIWYFPRGYQAAVNAGID